jgi:signal transduction histidine kinase
VNVAAGLSLSAFVLNTGTGILQLALARAPGWRRARTFALIALTAGAYAAVDLVLATDGFSDRVYQAFGRLNFALLGAHICGWIAYVYGGEDASFRALPRAARGFSIGLAALTGIFLLTGLQLGGEVEIVDAGHGLGRYHFPTTTALGEIYGAALFLSILVPVHEVVRRARRRERGSHVLLGAFALFLLCRLDELLVSNRVIEFLSLGDVGFVAIVLGTTIETAHRAIVDAHVLASLKQQLEGDLLVRTEERNRAQVALLESERLASLGQLAAGVGHEINNPLVYMILGLDRLHEHLASAGAPAEIHEALTDARDGADRIQRVVEGLRSYSHHDEERLALDPIEIVRAALNVTAPQLRYVANVELAFEPTPRVAAAESALVQVIGNLLVNAGHAVAERGSGLGSIVVRTTTIPSGEVAIEVRDDGVGLSPDDLRRIGEPCFTTRARAGGLGLGLFVSRGILTAHGGRLETESQLGAGTTVRVVLPSLLTPPVAPAARASPPTAPSTRRRLLLVDDDPAVLRSLDRALRRNWEVVSVASGSAALDAVRATPFDVVVCDLMMPGMSGMEVADVLRRSHPELFARTLFLTGGAVDEKAARFLERSDIRHELKPVRLDALERALASVVANPSG